MSALIKFLLIMGLLIGTAVYFHFNREEQQFSKTLFGSSELIQDTQDERQSKVDTRQKQS